MYNGYGGDTTDFTGITGGISTGVGMAFIALLAWLLACSAAFLTRHRPLEERLARKRNVVGKHLALMLLACVAGFFIAEGHHKAVHEWRTFLWPAAQASLYVFLGSVVLFARLTRTLVILFFSLTYFATVALTVNLVIVYPITLLAKYSDYYALAACVLSMTILFVFIGVYFRFEEFARRGYTHLSFFVFFFVIFHMTLVFGGFCHLALHLFRFQFDPAHTGEFPHWLGYALDNIMDALFLGIPQLFDMQLSDIKPLDLPAKLTVLVFRIGATLWLVGFVMQYYKNKWLLFSSIQPE